MENLFVKAEIFVNGKKHAIEKKILTPNSPLGAYDILQSQDMLLPSDINFNNLEQNNDIFVRYFAKKVENAPWILIKIDFLDI